ncbi:hypothetical protein [uncultured Gulosibacter sp.]|uniref:RCC1 domain-containing protein n=1 Tax=uncultured Gulosibacter sp. TaxID=1339167 RepID=UPI00288A8614|nr:hypothetical protein [uncultured Gulosibacter sp.]
MISPSVDAEGLYRIAQTPHVLDDSALVEIGEHPNCYPELRNWAFAHLGQLRSGNVAPPPVPPLEKPRRGGRATHPRPARVRPPRKSHRRNPARRTALISGSLALLVLAGGVTAVTMIRGTSSHDAAPLSTSDAAQQPDSNGAATPGSSSGHLADTQRLRASGESFDCVTYGNSVQCSGSNRNGALGLGDEKAPGPNVIKFDGEVTQLVAGMHFACATDGLGVTCWGNNKWRQTGQKDGASVTPAKIAELADKPVQHLWAGESHACASSNDEVWCWGSNNVGQIGNGAPSDPMAPTRVDFGSMAKVTDLFGSRFTTCAVREGYDKPWCWGSNLGGVIDAENDAEVLRPTPRRP